MSYADYKLGMEVAFKHTSDEFYGIIQAAMRLADTDNLEMLKKCWPQTWKEIQDRYRAPGGKLEGER